MTNLVEYFKGKPRTSLAILAIAAAITASWYAFDWQSDTPKYGGFAMMESSDGDAYGYGTTMGRGVGAYDKMASPSIAPMPYVADGIMPPLYPTSGETAAEVDQKIVKNGYLQLVVVKVSDVVTEIGRLATARGGFVQSSSVTERGNGVYGGEVSVRVPVAKFEEAMNEIKKLSVVVKNETSNGQDVTEQYTDLQAQLRNAKAQEETYLEVLKQARSVEDILKVQERLGSIRSVIESLTGRLKYLENTTSFSTISVSLEEEATLRAPTKEFRLGAIVRGAVQTLVGAFQSLIAGLVYFIIVWGGILLPIGLLSWIVWKIWKKRSVR